VHALLRAADSGLEFIGPDVNQLRINGTVGGEAIRFLNIVKGQGPVDADDLVTKDYVDAHIAGLDWQESVIDKDLTEPPKAPNDGDRYLLFNDPTAAWPSAKGTKVKKNDIVTFDRKLWVITTPDEGTATFVEDENVAYLFMDGTWTPFLAAPTVAAGDGLIAKGAIFSVGKGAGIVVNPDDVGVAFENNRPNPVGPVASPGKADTSARGDHVHDLPLAKEGGLVFDKELVIDGPVGGKKIVFLSPVAGQTPTGDEHLATKKYVDDQTEKIEAGDGLIRKADTIFVGQGAGIQVNPDDVAVAFDPNLPQAIAAVGSQGKANTVTRGDHAHALTLADQSGLAFDAKGLRVDGTVGGAQIRFVNRVSGQDPQVNEDLATKRYVDAKVVPAQPVVAGGGLIASDHTISVGPGDGLLIGEDSVAVKFSTATLPDSDKGDPGAEAAACRGDHRHPLPKITPATASGIVIFQVDGDAPLFAVDSPFIETGLGNGVMNVTLALETSPNSYLTGDMSNKELEVLFDMTADVRVGSASNPTTFRILLDSSRSNQPLPHQFQIRWFAYVPAIEARPVTVKLTQPDKSGPPQPIG